MKRKGYLYEQICSEENIRLAIRNSAKGKKNKHYIKRILDNEDAVVLKIRQLLIDKTYDLGKCRQRVIFDNSSRKERVITIPKYYPDQIIHWAVIQVIQPVLTRGMYEFSCGSVPGRGGKAVKKYLDRVLKKKVKYVLKIDVRKFFPSINHDNLKEMLSKRIKDRDTLELLYAIIDCGGQGLPIGFYTSQWLSNFYLQDIDHYIKEVLHVKYYVRYVDDMVLIDSNKRRLREAKAALAEKLGEYGLSLKDNWQIFKINSRPLDFVGYKYHKNFTLLRKSLFFHLTRVVRDIKHGGLNIYRARRYISLIGWAKRISFKHYYLSFIKPIISKRVAREYISRFDKRALTPALT